MAKKGGGGKKSFWDNPFGGMFDFNRDGKEDFGELWIAQKIFEECTKEKEPQHDYSSDYIYHSVLDDLVDTSWREFCEDGSEFDIDPEDYETEEEYDEALAEAKQKVAWRKTCEDGSDVFIDPEDYDTEDEYNEALEEARNAWRDTCEDGSEYGLDPDDFDTEDEYNEALEEAQASELDGISAPTISLQFSVECPALDKLEEIKEEDYPNKRRFNAAYTLANEFLCYSSKEAEQKDKACCQFIIDNADKITAANYLSYEGGFLYAQAIKDNFQLPVSLPDEDEYREYELSDALCKIAKRNVALSFEIWEWTLNTFLSYTQYADGSLMELTSDVIDDLYSFPENYRTELVRYKIAFLENNNIQRPKKNASAMIKKASQCFSKIGANYSLEDANADFQSWLSKQSDLSGGEKAYNRIDEQGKLYQAVSMSWPNKKKAPDDYFIPLVHPVTKKPCPVPERGWRNPSSTMKELLSKNLIIFGADETTQPRRKYLLEENMYENIPSLLYYGGSDTAFLNQIGVPYVVA